MPRPSADSLRSALLEAVGSHGGVARASSLVRAGHSRHHLATAIRLGDLTRVRRDWVALPEADSELLAAARNGVVLSCITQARRLGLWVLREDRPHVAADPHAAAGKPARATVHWGQPVLPRHPDALTDPLENTLVLVARCQPFEVALAVWESAMNARLIEYEALERLELGGAGRRVLRAAMPYADSGLETLFRERLRWLRLPIRAQVWIAGARVDLLIGERLVAQIDGGHHVGRQRARDVAHDAQLASMGYTVLRFTYEQIVHEWPAVQDAVLRAVAGGRHRR